MSNFLNPQPSPDRLKFKPAAINKPGNKVNFDFSRVDPGDIICELVQGNSNKVRLVSNPLTPNSNSFIQYNASVDSPCEVSAAFSTTQRIRLDYPIFGVVDKSNTYVQPKKTWNITGFSQTASLATITLDEPFLLPLGTLVNINGISDNRANYKNAPIALVTATGTTIQITTSDSGAIPSLTISQINNQGTLTLVEDFFMEYADGAAYVLASSTTTSAELHGRESGFTRLCSGITSLSGDRRSTISTSNPSVASGGVADIFFPSTEYRFQIEPRSVLFDDRATDSSVSFNARGRLNTSVSSVNRTYSPYFGITSPPELPRPVAKITAISRTSNVVTITLDVDAASAGITTSQYLQISGVRDQTNFADNSQFTIVPTSVTGNTITLAWSGTNASSYGGFISIPQGGIGVQGRGPVITSVTVETEDRLLVVCSSTPTWLNEAVIYLNGVCNSAGVNLGVDGPWVVGRISSANMWLTALVDHNGVRRSPVVTPAAAVDTGGSQLQATVLDINFVNCINKYAPSVRIEGQGTASAAQAIPVISVGGSLTVAQGTALSATGGVQGWPVIPGSVSVTDITSAAITTTSTSTAVTIGTSSGAPSGMQFIFPIGTVSGTSPTLDTSIEGTEDGSNWRRIYDLPRVTSGSQALRTPVLSVEGLRSIRYVRTIGGTSPSFTMSAIRNTIPFFGQISSIYNFIDRTVALQTINSATPNYFIGDTTRARLSLFVTSAGTPPAVQLQGSDDNGVSWYDIGSSITAVAGTTVSSAEINISTSNIRAVVKTAGATVVGGWVSIRAY